MSENFIQRACDAGAFVVSRKDNAISCGFQCELSAFGYETPVSGITASESNRRTAKDKVAEGQSLTAES
jgi:hypothetical protein